MGCGRGGVVEGCYLAAAGWNAKGEMKEPVLACDGCAKVVTRGSALSAVHPAEMSSKDAEGLHVP